MAHLQWSSALDTGIAVIDEQHKRIVLYINELYEAREARDEAQVGEVLTELLDYAYSHFGYEERFMREIGFPSLEAHQQSHQLFSQKVEDFVSRYEAGEDVVDDLINTLNRWLINHIKNEDGDYADYHRKQADTNP
ncbi:bacteriohemerythrin [Magnetovirga frankeli]|uniref:bacteriohemerythrin n=1 Tax=Magnetovirga frankeli TaxID=947516 RepID=UPI001293F72D|nr:bacteriohemerythrin [gamma proteobacterium SS-5]